MGKNIIVVALIFLPFWVVSQPFNSSKNFYFGLSGGTGFINPVDVNKYMTDRYRGYFLYPRDPSMKIALVLDTFFSLRFSRYMDIQTGAGLGWASETVKDSHGHRSDMYNFFRFSWATLANLHLPVKDNSIVLGGGPLYSHLTMESMKAGSKGYRIRWGYNVHGNDMIIRFFAFYDNAMGKSKWSNMDLDFSGVNIGASINLPLLKRG
jgi:hypothetical protein